MIAELMFMNLIAFNATLQFLDHMKLYFLSNPPTYHIALALLTLLLKKHSETINLIPRKVNFCCVLHGHHGNS